MKHERFHYKTQQELMETARALGVHIPLAEDTQVLRTPLRAGTPGTPGSAAFANRLGTAPMEGADSLPDGSPSEMTVRRYVQNARGGSAILWFEAISMMEEARSSATQLMISRDNLEAYKRLVETVKEAGRKANGYAPYLVLQANHSGRYSNPGNRPAPLIAYRHPILEQYRPADDACIVSDEYLDRMAEHFAETAYLAREAGFDAVDVKACHGYLLMELLSAYGRPGRYGGSYENRTRCLRDGICAAKTHETSDFAVTCRLGIYDGYAWPWGFGVAGPEDPGAAQKALAQAKAQAEDGVLEPGAAPVPDLAEPIRLVRELYQDLGVRFVDLTMGNPYATTHVTRPFDAGKYPPDEHPLEGIARMIGGIGQVKRAVPEMTILASAPSYLRQYADLYTAGAVEEGLCDGMLFGRLSFADPNFANEIRDEARGGRIDPGRVCVTCGKCGDLIRSHKPTGCVVRDPGTFLPYYRAFEEEKKSLPENFRG